MTDHERINELEARVVVLERIITEFQSGIVDWAEHAVAEAQGLEERTRTQAQQARKEGP